MDAASSARGEEPPAAPQRPKVVIRMGMCSWTDKTFDGTFYPLKNCRTAADKLSYYAQKFPLVEVDSSNYAITPPSRVKDWVNNTPKQFLFHFKAFQMFTMRQVDDIGRMPGMVRELMAEKLQMRPSTAGPLKWEELSHEEQEMCWTAQNNSLNAAAEAGKLGVCLFQMQPGFYYKEEHKQFLAYIRSKLLPAAEMAVEFRDASWLLPKHQQETLTFLKQNKISLVSMDETVRLSLEYRKQQQRLEKEAKLASSESAEGDPIDLIMPGDEKRMPMRQAISMHQTHPGFLYVRIHRREGEDRLLDDKEMAGWVERIEEFVDNLEYDANSPSNFYIDFLWNTNWEDQSAQNAKKLSSLILASPTLSSKVELFDWASIVKQEFQSKGIAGMFNKIRSKATGAAASAPAPAPSRPDEDDEDAFASSQEAPSSSTGSSSVQIKREPEIKPEPVEPRERPPSPPLPDVMVVDDSHHTTSTSGQKKRPREDTHAATASPSKRAKTASPVKGGKAASSAPDASQRSISSFFKPKPGPNLRRLVL